jgi:ADP-ribose pyrophosphatase YjhB (NUDIX family)
MNTVDPYIVGDSSVGLPSPVSPEVFAQLMATFPRVCADIVIIDKSSRELILAQRKAHPSGPWMIGGGIFAGELAEAAAVRKVQQELGINISVERLDFVWRRRLIFPTWDSDVYLFALELSSDELAQLHPDKDEYTSEQLTRYSRQQLLEIKEEQGQLLVDIWDQIFAD